MDRDPRVLPAGKLPPELLAQLLPEISQSDSSVIVGPRVGTDAAAIDMGDRVLVVKSDPVTFSADDPGWYLVNVNANDIACMGGIPKWLLVTALLPEKSTTPELVRGIFDSLQRACAALDITLVGGHTEITLGLDRPILVGAMFGTTTRAGLIDPSSVEPGDAILLCNGIAIEGTALLSGETNDSRLHALPDDLLERCQRLLESPGISIVRAARELIASGVRIHAMHDPTEGGLASAIRELAVAASCGATIDLDSVFIYPETLELCGLLELDPMGLIASGALLAVVPESEVDRALAEMKSAGIACARIGTILNEDSGVKATRAGTAVELPSFDVDEIARFYANS